MLGQRFKVGIVGLQPGRSWAARAHLPALRALSETFEIAGVANSSRSSAEDAAAANGGAWPLHVHAIIAEAAALPRSVVYAFLATLRGQERCPP
jgi:predicted dehydrogenase